jgi:MFS family permease
MEARVETFASVQIPDFRLLLAGRLLATLAILIQTIAVGWQIYSLTQDPLMLGCIGLAEALPAIGVGLYAGHVADVADRRLIALASIFVLLLSMLGLFAGSAYIHDNNVLTPIIFALIALTGFARGFYGPAVFGMVSDIIPRELYGNAAAWNTAVWQASAVAGPILGGIIYVGVGGTATYFLSAVLLVGSLICFFLTKTRTVLHKTEEKVSIAENIKEGLRFVFSNEVIVGAMAMDLFAVLFGGVVALLPIFAKEIFQMGPQALGVLRAAPSVGSFIIAAILTRHPISRRTGHVFLASVAGFGLCMIGFGLSRNFYVSFLLLVISGILDGISMWTRSTVYQLLTPSNMKGRMAAVNQMFIGSSNEIGEFESGVAAKFLGLIPSVLFGGCMTLLVVAVAFVKAPKLRKLHIQNLYKEVV